MCIFFKDYHIFQRVQNFLNRGPIILQLLFDLLHFIFNVLYFLIVTNIYFRIFQLLCHIFQVSFLYLLYVFFFSICVYQH